MDSAFWEASSADTASELSRCTVAWASSVMSITPLLWRWDNDGVWDRDEAFTVFLLLSIMLLCMVSDIRGVCCRGDWVICVTATNSSSSFVIILPVSLTTPFLLSSVV